MRLMLRSLLIVAVVVAAASVRADDDVKITPDVVYGHKHGMALTLDVFTPKEPNGAGVLFMVSGGWFSRWYPPERAVGMFQAMLDKGLTVFAVRHGSSPKYVIPEIIEDVRRSVRFIRLKADQFGVDPERLGVTGGSAGGHLSLVLGTTSDEGNPQAEDEVLRASDRVAAVVAYYPPTDLRSFVEESSGYPTNYPALKFEASKADDCSPILHVTPDDPPTLLIHGDQDKLVPLEHSTNIMAEFKEKNVTSELLVIEGAAHGFHGENGKRASQASADWFEKHLLDK